MLRKLRPRSAYDVMAAITFFIVVASGSAYAAATIGSGNIKNDAVLSRHIKNGQVKNLDLGPNSVRTGKVADGSLLRRDFKAGVLGGSSPVAVAANQAAQPSDPNPCDSGQTAVFCGNFTGEPKVWENYGQGYAPAAFFMDGAGIVHLTGAVKASAPQAPNPFFILPPSYRPSTRHAFTGWCMWAGEGACRIEVSADGYVEQVSGVPALGFASLEGISFRAGG
ncbi:MAG: hypothetical protein ACJ76D_07180 [Solirubrobacterales bacterium]